MDKNKCPFWIFKKEFKKRYFCHILHLTEIKSYKFINITISSSKNDFLVFQSAEFSFSDDVEMLIVVYYILYVKYNKIMIFYKLLNNNFFSSG